jgi:excisionase family DNA binding protein
MENDGLLTIDQAATYLQVNPETVRRWLRRGVLAGINLGGSAGWRIERDDLRHFVDVRRSPRKGAETRRP